MGLLGTMNVWQWENDIDDLAHGCGNYSKL